MLLLEFDFLSKFLHRCTLNGRTQILHLDGDLPVMRVSHDSIDFTTFSPKSSNHRREASPAEKSFRLCLADFALSIRGSSLLLFRFPPATRLIPKPRHDNCVRSYL